jgi:hypothetical protein
MLPNFVVDFIYLFIDIPYFVTFLKLGNLYLSGIWFGVAPKLNVAAQVRWGGGSISRLKIAPGSLMVELKD